MENATVIAKCGVVVLKTPLADFLALVMEKSYGFYQGSLLCLNNFKFFLPYTLFSGLKMFSSLKKKNTSITD